VHHVGVRLVPRLAREQVDRALEVAVVVGELQQRAVHLEAMQVVGFAEAPVPGQDRATVRAQGSVVEGRGELAQRGLGPAR
jgi:hypothetical protein